MCDFIITFDRDYCGADLVKLLRKVHLTKPPKGSGFDFAWGSAAVLESAIETDNIIVDKDNVFAWVGDLVMSGRDKIQLKHRIASMLAAGLGQADLKYDPAFEKLNGAFAIMYASQHGLAVIVDPLALTQIYAGYDHQYRLVAIGTHADLVAAVSGSEYSLDMVSIAEFLNRGSACFPYTMHTNVRKLYPGSCNIIRMADGELPVLQSSLYWLAPPEHSSTLSIKDLADEFDNLFRNAVADRCTGDGQLGIMLSGGLDSRLIMAVLPHDTSCLAVTFCDKINREATIASQVAKAYNQPWIPLYRDKEYIARSVVQNVRFSGCECDWIHGHASALAGEMALNGISTVLSGYLMDTFFRGYFAKDITYKKRLFGALAPVHVPGQYDWIGMCSEFCNQYLSRELKEQIFARRKSYFQTRVDSSRGSIVEWLDVYPFSQRPESGTWAVERRCIPLRVAAMDRRLLDFSFSCPAMLRANGKMFKLASNAMFGPGAYIPNANNGTSPAGGHIRHLAQRVIRKTQDFAAAAMARAGRENCVQHSWHDYQQYWFESKPLKMLVEEHRPHLNQFEGLIFNEKLSPLSNPHLLNWRDGFRLLALAVWKSALADYRLELEMTKLNPLRAVTVTATSSGPVTITVAELNPGDLNRAAPATPLNAVANTSLNVNAAVKPTQN